jgi:hypothetical protein
VKATGRVKEIGLVKGIDRAKEQNLVGRKDDLLKRVTATAIAAQAGLDPVLDLVRQVLAARAALDFLDLARPVRADLGHAPKGKGAAATAPREKAIVLAATTSGRVAKIAGLTMTTKRSRQR